jgi:hypothetical protein
MQRRSYKHLFIEAMPEKLEEGILYVSIRYATCAHNCFCGCGHEVVTPIHPTKWKLMFDGIHVSLQPSIGNWSLPCQSHYWLKNGRIAWGERLSEDEIKTVRGRDLAAQDDYYGKSTSKPQETRAATSAETPRTLWQALSAWLMQK